MTRIRFLWLAVLALLLSLPVGALAFAPTGDPTEMGPHLRTHVIDPEVQARYAPLIEAFEAEEGGSWEAVWDGVTGTPWVVRGSGIAIPRSVTASRERLEAYLRAFVDRHPDLFRVRSSDLELSSIFFNLNVWYVDFSQTVRGIPVLKSRVRFRIKFDRLILFGVQTYTPVPDDLRPVVSREGAQEILRRDVAFHPRRDRIEAPGRLVLYPTFTDDAATLRLAWEIGIETFSPHRRWIGYVDAHSGEILERYDQIFRFSGNVKAEIEARKVGDPLQLENLPNDRVVVSGQGEAVTDANGDWRIPGSGTASATMNLSGPISRVANAGGSDAQMSFQVSDTPVESLWDDDNSLIAERDTFRGINIAKAMAKSVFPTVSWLDAQLPANVNDTFTCGTSSCNACWTGTTIIFIPESSSCNDSGRILDVILHEFGHGLDQNAPGGAQDRSLGEFIGDWVAVAYTGSPSIGPTFCKQPGFPCQGTVGAIRELEPDLYYPTDLTGEVHDNGQVLGSTMWDVRKALVEDGVSGQDLLNLMIGPIADAQALDEWYDAVVVLDDDDGNLANGTPHACLIWDGFDAHSRGSGWPIPNDRPDCNHFRGRLTLARSLHSCNGTLDITLTDEHLAGNGTAVIEASSDTETTPERVTLQEVGDDPGTFTGTFPLAPGDPAPDGQLQVAHGDVVVLSYFDEDTGNGESEEITLETSIDCQPPRILEVNTGRILDFTADILVTTDEEAGVRILYGQSPELGLEAVAESFATAHTITLEGLVPRSTYYYDVEVSDIAGNLIRDDNGGRHYRFTNFPPEIRLLPPAIDAKIAQGEIAERVLEMTNGADDRELTFRIEKVNPDFQGQGISGPYSQGYVWIDSDTTGGPQYDWQRVDRLGEQIFFRSPDGDDAVAGPFDIGFEFPFFGTTVTQFWVSTNGFITFEEPESSASGNSNIPNASPPNNLIAPFWDDLQLAHRPVHPRHIGNAYYYRPDPDTLIVSFEEAQMNFEPWLGRYTFQVILSSNGDIKFQYKEIGFEPNRATIGIESPDGRSGLEIAYDRFYIHDEMAILIQAVSPWLGIDPIEGTIPAGETLPVTLRFNPEGMQNGHFESMLRITSNDPLHPIVQVPVGMDLSDGGTARLEINAAPITFYAIEGGDPVTQRFTLTTGGGPGEIDFTVDADQPFVVSPRSGSTPAEIVLGLDPGSLSAENTPYEGALRVQSNGSNPVTIPLTAHILHADNEAPVARASLSPAEPTSADTISLVATASSDPDGDDLLYFWQQTSGTTALNIQDATSATATIAGASPGTYEVTLIVSDGVAWSMPVALPFTVREPETPCGIVPRSGNGAAALSLLSLLLFAGLRRRNRIG